VGCAVGHHMAHEQAKKAQANQPAQSPPPPQAAH
jgi:hypothetical protein